MRYLLLLLLIGCNSYRSNRYIADIPEIFSSENNNFTYKVINCRKYSCKVEVISGIKGVGSIFHMHKTSIYNHIKTSLYILDYDYSENKIKTGENK